VEPSNGLPKVMLAQNSSEDQNGDLQSSHVVKADILWNSFKDRLGQSAYQNLSLDLNSLLQASSQLGCLEEPFTHEEINSVIKNLPADKSTGPDGFNTDFIKNVGP